MSYIPRAMVTMAGSLPPGWEDWYAKLTDPPEISSSAADAWWADRWEHLRPTCADDKSTDSLVTFLRGVLVVDRFTPNGSGGPTRSMVPRRPFTIALASTTFFETIDTSSCNTSASLQ